MSETTMAPGIWLSHLAPIIQMPQVATPDLKLAAQGGVLLHVDLAAGARRLGGSALAQAYGQVGDESPDVDPAHLKGMWNAVQVGTPCHAASA